MQQLPERLRILLPDFRNKIEFFLLIARRYSGAIAKKQNPFSKINHIFISHLHGDHFFDIGLVSNIYS
jgi:ribonuclease BN (tRNA processing enzyme)